MLRLLGSHHCSISNVNCDLRAWKWLFLSVDYLVCSLSGKHVSLTATSIRIKVSCARRTCVHLISISCSCQCGSRTVRHVKLHCLTSRKPVITARTSNFAKYYLLFCKLQAAIFDRAITSYLRTKDGVLKLTGP